MSFLSNIESEAKSVAQVAAAPVVAAAQQSAQSIVTGTKAALSATILAAAKKLNGQLQGVQAQYGQIVQQVRALEAKEKELSTAISLLQQQLTSYASEAGTDVATLLKSL